MIGMGGDNIWIDYERGLDFFNTESRRACFFSCNPSESYEFTIFFFFTETIWVRKKVEIEFDIRTSRNWFRDTLDDRSSANL